MLLRILPTPTNKERKIKKEENEQKEKKTARWGRKEGLKCNLNIICFFKLYCLFRPFKSALYTTIPYLFPLFNNSSFVFFLSGTTAVAKPPLARHLSPPNNHLWVFSLPFPSPLPPLSVVSTLQQSIFSISPLSPARCYQNLQNSISRSVEVLFLFFYPLVFLYLQSDHE